MNQVRCLAGQQLALRQHVSTERDEPTISAAAGHEANPLVVPWRKWQTLKVGVQSSKASSEELPSCRTGLMQVRILPESFF